MHVVVIQYETRRDRALRLLMKYTEDYCHLHGYTYFCPQEPYSLPTYWVKVHLLQTVLKSVPVSEDLCVAWMDSDAVFVNPDLRIETILQKSGRDFVTSLDPGSTTQMNAGVFFLRRTPQTQQLVDDWMACYNPARWTRDGEKWTTTGRWAGPDYEQGAFNERILPKYRHLIALEPEKRFACYEATYNASETDICHFMYTHKRKIWLYNLRRNAPELLAWSAVLGLVVFWGRSRTRM